jgi:hypothetical protein
VAWLGAGANGCYSVNTDKSASFDLFIPPSAGLAGGERAEIDCNARISTFFSELTVPINLDK